MSARKERALLAYLALRAGTEVSVGKLIEALWGDNPPASDRKTLHNYVKVLRDRLPAGAIETTTTGYRLCLEPEAVDVTRFEHQVQAAIEAAAEGDTHRVVAESSSAMKLWRGDPLPDLADQPIGMAEASWLLERRRIVEDHNFSARLELGQHAELIGDLEAAVAAEPLRERRWEQLMIALYRSGRQIDALRAFQRLRDALADAGVEPGQSARDLEAAILAQAPDLSAPVKPPAAAAPEAPQRASHLPTGNVTFLFSDLEGSTKMANRLGAEYATVLNRLKVILRSVVAAYDGVEVGPTGDGVFAAFADAGRAIGACLDGQRSLASNDWPEGGEARVRMGLHTGVARPNDEGDYVSVAVHEAERICSAGHGGQVLMSGDTARMVRHVLPSGAGLVDRGIFLLRGFDEPEHIYQLTHPELRSVFPPLRASPAQSHNLPDLRMDFIGRRKDLGGVEGLLDEGRLVTVVGAGGAGKTRLAVEVGARLAARFPGGVHLCDLSPQTDAGLVASAIGEAFGVEDAGDPLGAVIGLVDDRATLLVLDSCEHLIASVGDVVDTLLASSAGLRILATSREPLGVEGERLWRLEALGVPEPGAGLDAVRSAESVQLFEGRARLVQPEFAVVDANAAAVAQICRELEGLPLAIELAAAQAGALSPDDIAHRLANRVHTLASGSDHRAQRHRSLEAAVDWSYRLLGEDDRRLLRFLSVFANGFTLDAARAVSDSDDPVAVLTRLVDKSLIVWDRDASRYRMLESIRAFARARLDEAGETDTACARHLAWCAGLADTLRTGGSPPETYDLFGRELDNLRVALLWAASHSPPEDDSASRDHETEGGGTREAPATWELVVRPDRSYFDRVQADGVEFPRDLPERRFELAGDRVTIGRRDKDAVPDVDLYVDRRSTDWGISRNHAFLVQHGEAWAIVDAGSENGTFVNQQDTRLPPGEPFVLREVDEVHVGAWTSLSLRRKHVKEEIAEVGSK